MKLFKNKIKINYNSLKNSEIAYFFAPFPWIRVNYKYLFDLQLFSKYQYQDTTSHSRGILFLDPNRMYRVYKSKTKSSQRDIIQDEIILKTHIHLNEIDQLNDLSDFINSKELNKTVEQRSYLESVVKKSINNDETVLCDKKGSTEKKQKLDDIIEIFQKISSKY